MHTTTSADLLREARHRAGLTQAELAKQAGTTQSVISAYESSHRQPALATLATLVGATGLELEIRVRRRRQGLDRLTGPRGRQIRRQRRVLVETAASHGVTDLRVFGSVARGEDGPESDVDLLAALPPGMGLLALGRLRKELEDLLDARVDLVPADGLKPDVARRITVDLVSL
jgi:predicted nucleotidyltransferase/DNA-binding XRE family transcriptional regulator